jgi:hypothetical protein
MKRLVLFLTIFLSIFFSNSAFSEGLRFELNGKQYEAASNDLYGDYSWERAMSACKGIVDLREGNRDWYLPSKEELNAMYEGFYKDGLGGFVKAFYWTSSDYSSIRAWAQYFDFFGTQFRNDKQFNLARVRCIREIKE